MNQKNSVDESLTLKLSEWTKILECNDLNEIKSIVLSAKEKRNKSRKSKVQKKEEYLQKVKTQSKKRLQETAEKFRSDLIKNQTPSEARLKVILRLMGIKYEFQKIYYTKKSFYVADFYLTEHDIVIELDGGYHNTQEQKKKDSIRTKELKNDVRAVFRMTNNAVENVELATKLVNEFLEKNKKKLTQERMNKL